MTKSPIDFTHMINWNDLHRDYVSYEFGTKLAIRADGSWFPVGSGMSMRGLEHVAMLACPGGNLDSSVYSEGWCGRQSDGTYVTPYGEYFSCEGSMMAAAIDRGDWDGLYEQWAKDFLQQQVDAA